MRQLFGWFLAGALLLSACAPAASDTPKALVFAMDPALGTPFVYEASAKNYGGFEVDLGKYIATKLERPFQVQTGSWGSLPELVRRKKADIALSAIEKTTDASVPKALQFTAPYYTAYQKLTVHADDNYTYNLSDLKGKKVGVVKHSVGALLLEELNRLKKSQIEIKAYETPEALFSALFKKEVTATLTERAVASWHAWKNKDLKLTGDAITTPLPYVGLVRAEDQELLKAVNDILTQAVKDPEFQKIFDKWHVSIKR